MSNDWRTKHREVIMSKFLIEFIQCAGSLCCLGLAVILYLTGEAELCKIAYLSTFIFLWIIPLLYIVFRKRDNDAKSD